MTGDIVSLLYKVPTIRLTVALSDGRQTSFRLIPGMARGGFVISPFIGDQKSFSLLSTREGFRTLGSWEVRSMMISVDDEDGKSSSYWTPQHIRFYRLEYLNQGKNQNQPSLDAHIKTWRRKPSPIL